MVKDLRSEAEAEGYDSKLLYRAAKDLGVAEYTVDGLKWWKLPIAS